MTHPGFVSRLAQFMATANLSRAALAREIGVNKTVISRWLSGANHPSSHNLMHLTRLARQTYPDLTMAHWTGAMPPSADPPPPDALITTGLALSGLRTPVAPGLSAVHEGLWGGFLQLSENGWIRPFVCCFRPDGAGLRAAATDGTYTGEGPVVLTPSWIQILLEVGTTEPRLWSIVLNAAAERTTAVTTGLVLAGQPGVELASAVVAMPVILLRLGAAAEFETIGGLVAVEARLKTLRAAGLASGTLDADPLGYWEAYADREVLEHLRIRVRAPLEDGSIDFTPRMPRNREPLVSNRSYTLPDSPVGRSIARLRAGLGLA